MYTGWSVRHIWTSIGNPCPKLKTHSGAAKRFKKTGTGKFKRGHSKMRHILTSKNNKTKSPSRQVGLDLRGGFVQRGPHAALRLGLKALASCSLSSGFCVEALDQR